MGKLGDKKAVEYLVQMLDDPDIREEKSYIPGRSLDAAKALCGLHEWPFEWDKSCVAKTAERAQQAGLTSGK